MRNIAIIILVFCIVSACSNANVENADENLNLSGDQIQLSPEQIDQAKIKTSKIEKLKVSETVECSGVIDVSPDDRASVSPIINGFVQNILIKEGEFVKEKAVLVTLTHPDFITLQKLYLENKSQVDYFEKEFKRQGELTVENAASIKNMEKAQAEYWTAQANYKSAKTQLEMLGINPGIIEKGDFIKEFKIIAPISGYISKLNVNAGKYIEATDEICEIINSSNILVNLNIFEKDIPKIKIGQKISFYLINDNKEIISNKIQNIGVQIDEADRTVKAMCKIENKSKKLIPGMFIRASIYFSEREAYCLPSSAIANSNSQSFIFIKSGNNFLKKQINVGIEQNGFIEISSNIKDILEAEFVTEGTYFLIREEVSE